MASRTLDADEGRDVLRARRGQQRPDPVHSPARVLQVDQDEIRAGAREDPWESDRVELEHHGAERETSARQTRAQRFP